MAKYLAAVAATVGVVWAMVALEDRQPPPVKPPTEASVSQPPNSAGDAAAARAAYDRGDHATALSAARPAAEQIKARSIKMPIGNRIEHPQGVGAKKFAELIEQKSGGKIKVKVFAGGVLGGEQQVASSMQGGTVEVSMMAPAQLVGDFKDFLVLDFPFAFANEREADAVLDGPLGRKLLEPMPARGLVGLACMEQGYRSITNSKRPITRLEDIQGLKIRTVLNPLYIDMLNALGADAVPMPFPERKPATKASFPPVC